MTIHLLELTLVYTNALNDTIKVYSEAMREHPEFALRYARLLDYLRSLVSNGEGGLLAVAHEVRVLLGEAIERG